MQIREIEVRYKPSSVPLERGEKFSCSEQIFRAFLHMWLLPVETFQVVCPDGAYPGETGHPIRGKWPPGRSEATLGIS